MKKNETVFDYVGQIFQVFGFSVICLCVFSFLFGADAKGYSSLFELGNTGLSIQTMSQFLLMSVIITTLRFILFTDGLIKKLSIVLRIVIMFSLIVIMMALFIIWFGWFPVNMWLPWAMFLLCFAISAGISTVLSILKERIENRKMEEALQRLKQGGK